jgi:uncharacterized protein (DUF2141 family)
MTSNAIPFSRIAATLAITAAALAATAPAHAQAGCAHIDVTQVRPNQGFLMLAAYGSADAFGKTPLAQLRVPAGDATMRVALCGLSGEAVAITAFQDLDGDGKLAKNLFGLPTEPWGASGKPGAMGPSWDNARVALDGTPIGLVLSR